MGSSKVLGCRNAGSIIMITMQQYCARDYAIGITIAPGLAIADTRATNSIELVMFQLLCEYFCFKVVREDELAMAECRALPRHKHDGPVFST